VCVWGDLSILYVFRLLAFISSSSSCYVSFVSLRIAREKHGKTVITVRPGCFFSLFTKGELS
jgi:hypothetical protein